MFSGMQDGHRIQTPRLPEPAMARPVGIARGWHRRTHLPLVFPRGRGMTDPVAYEAPLHPGSTVLLQCGNAETERHEQRNIQPEVAHGMKAGAPLLDARIRLHPHDQVRPPVRRRAAAVEENRAAVENPVAVVDTGNPIQTKLISSGENDIENVLVEHACSLRCHCLSGTGTAC